MSTDDGLRYIDSDGHILEHPTAMPDYAPAKYRDRIWHVETDEAGEEWLVYNGIADVRRTACRRPAWPGPATRTGPGRFRGEMRYTETRPAAWNAKARLQDMDQDHIDLAGAVPDHAAGAAERARRGLRRGAGAGLQRLVLGSRPRGRGPPVRGGGGAADARRRRRGPGGRGDPPGGDAAGDGVDLHAAQPGGGLAAVQRPGVRPDLAGRVGDRACRSRCTPSSRPDLARRLQGSAPRRPRVADGSYVDDFDPERGYRRRAMAHPELRPSTLFTQAIANPVDVMSCIAYLLAGGVCERFPEAKFIFLEANGGLAGAVAGAARPPLPQVPVGGHRPVAAAVGVHEAPVLDQLRPRRGHAAHRPPSRRWSAPTGSSGRRTIRTPTPSSPA